MRNSSLLLAALLAGFLGAAPRAACAAPAPVVVEVDSEIHQGLIRPLQDVADGPLCERGAIDLTPYYQALGVRNVRLHDVPWAYDNALDINYVFPRWRASARRPSSYDFTLSDFYLASIARLHLNVIYRLGYSAEFRTPVHHNTPPASFEKFAAIAGNLVRHYNDGWASGHEWGIRYWEVWNEPDIRFFWTGTPADYDRLYEATAKRLKQIDPSLEVGGPALSDSLDFLEQFLQYCRAHKVPLDFVSWHSYVRDPRAVVERARVVRALMRKYGFGDAQSILDEWNYGPTDWSALLVDPKATREFFDSTQGSVGAAYDAAVLMALQDAPVDIATFFTGTTEQWGMFTPTGAPQKPYFAFLAFHELLGSPRRIAVTVHGGKDDRVTALAGSSEDGRTVRILLSSRSRSPTWLLLELAHVPWSTPSRYSVQVLDDSRDLQEVGGERAVTSRSIRMRIGAESVVLITVRPDQAASAIARPRTRAE